MTKQNQKYYEKELELSKTKQINLVIHNGFYHADDVMCIVLAKLAMKESEKDINFNIIRTRNITEEMKNDKNTIIFDVGLEFDSEKMLFDHHQENCPNYPDGTKMAAVGLYYEYLKNNGFSLNKEYEDIIKNISALDNGVKGYNDDIITAYVKSSYPTWEYNGSLDEKFFETINFIKENFYNLDIIKQKTQELIEKNKESIERGITKVLKEKEGQDEIVCLSLPSLPWGKVLPDTNAKFVIYETSTGQINLQAVPPEVDSFQQKIPIPTDLLDDIPKENSPFVHKGQFICGIMPTENFTKEQVINYLKDKAQMLIKFKELNNSKQNDFDKVCEEAISKAEKINQNQDERTINQNQNKDDITFN